MPSRCRQSRAATKRKPPHPRPGGSYAGFDGSPLKSPELSDSKRRRPLTPKVLLSEEISENLLHQTKESLKRGRPESSFDEISLQTIVQKLLTSEQFPEWVRIRCRTPVGVKLVFQTTNDNYITISVDCSNLSCLASHEGRPLPSNLQMQSTLENRQQLIAYMESLREIELCVGMIHKIEYLKQKKVFVKEDTRELVYLYQHKSHKIGVQANESYHDRIQWRTPHCQFVSDNLSHRCSSCAYVLKQVYKGRQVCINQPELDQTFSIQLSNIADSTSHQSWTPFMKSYFEESESRNKTSKWKLPTLIFATSMYCKLGTNGYKELRKSLNLPSCTKIRELVSRIPAKPGINDAAIASYLNRQPDTDICLSFDEIYIHQGLKIIRHKEQYLTIGMSMVGRWDSSDPHRIQLLFSQPEPIEGFSPTHSVPTQETNNTPTAAHNWCSEAEATAILNENDGKMATMALHFMLSSISTPTCQAIGYVEVSAVNARLLRALVFMTIQAVHCLSSALTLTTVPTETTTPADTTPVAALQQTIPISTGTSPSQETQMQTVASPLLTNTPTSTSSAATDPWSFYHSFAQNWSENEIPQPSLACNYRLELAAPWLTDQVSNQPFQRPRIVCISFDGSSHARSFVNSAAANGYCQISFASQQTKCKNILHRRYCAFI